MTIPEMTVIFAAFLHAYPHAEAFKGGRAKLETTIALWANCLADVDAWTAERAAAELIRTSKWPPTIAEFAAMAATVRAETQSQISRAYFWASRAVKRWGPAESYDKLPFDTQRVVAAMGGMDAFASEGRFDMAGFFHAYEQLLRKEPTGLPGATPAR